jgi:hypothetical protein
MRPGSRAVVIAALATIGLAGAGQAAAAVPGLCDPVLPKASVTAGMTGTGYTVERGRTVDPFSVDILGILKDGIAPGRDMIVVEVDSPAVDRAGGIWAGMSGSPVYVGGQLVGAVAYGLSSTTSRIGGLTPAEDMLGLLGLPGPAIAASSISVDAPRRVQLHGSLARTVAARADLASASGAAMTQLKVPLSVSGLTPHGLDRVSSFVTHANPSLVPHAGSSASKTITAGPSPLMPGDSFASVASYGESSVAAVGTVTYVCNGVALAFGHPFEFGGTASPTGANAADALAVVPDLISAYKLANVAETVGTVDQDRLAGLRANLGATPATFPVHSVVNVPDLGRRHEGESQIAMADWASTVTLYQLFGELESYADSAGTGFDSAGRGTVSAWWTFEGTRDDGTPWKISRGNRWVSKLGVDFTAAFNVAAQLDALIANTVEDVKVTNVKVSLTREQAFNLYSVKKLLVSKNGGRWSTASTLSVRPNTRLRVRAILHPFAGGPNKVVQLRFHITARTMGGLILVGGSRGGFSEDCIGNQICFFFDEEEPASDFDELLDQQADAPRNDVLFASLVSSRGREAAFRQVRQPAVVVGLRAIRLHPAGTAPPDDDFFLRPFP